MIEIGEGQTIELKEKVSSSLGEDLCAFANAQGGFLIIGAKDSGLVAKTRFSNKDLSAVQNIARSMNPSLKIETKKIKDLIIIHVSEGGNKPYSWKSSFYIRDGPNSQKLNSGEIRKFFQEENLISFETKKCLNFRPTDFSEEVFNRFREKVKLDKDLPKDHILQNLNLLTEGGSPNNACVFFFAKDIKKHVMTASIQCFLYLDDERTDILDSKEFSRDFVSNLENAYSYTVSKLNTAIVINNNLAHKKVLEIPSEVLREAITNAMVHKNYFINSNVQINITPKKVEVVNPGKLLFPKSKLGRKSLRRNPVIADLMHRLNLIEKAGSGIQRIKKMSEKRGVKIKFELDEDFRTIFYRKHPKKPEANPKQAQNKSEANPKQAQNKSEANPKQAQNKSEANPKQAQNKSEANPKQRSKNSLEDRRNWIFLYLVKNEKIKAETVEKFFKIHRDTALRDLKSLQKQIVRKGSGNNFWYELRSKKRRLKN